MLSFSRRRTSFFPKGVQVNLFKCRSIQKGSLTRASCASPFCFLSTSLSLSLSLFVALFCHSTCTALSYDIRQHEGQGQWPWYTILKFVYKCLDDAVRGYPAKPRRVLPREKRVLRAPFSPSFWNRQVTPERLHRGQGLLRYQEGYTRSSRKKPREWPVIETISDVSQ